MFLSLALDVDPVLNMLVFGESILNDAVAIVLTTTIVGQRERERERERERGSMCILYSLVTKERF